MSGPYTGGSTFEPGPDPDPGAGLRTGDWVEHDHFGLGRVEALSGSGANARATVAFRAQGTRQLLLQYARLRPVPSGGPSGGKGRR
jgi:hypothetical protein